MSLCLLLDCSPAELFITTGELDHRTFPRLELAGIDPKFPNLHFASTVPVDLMAQLKPLVETCSDREAFSMAVAAIFGFLSRTTSRDPRMYEETDVVVNAFMTIATACDLKSSAFSDIALWTRMRQSVCQLELDVTDLPTSSWCEINSIMDVLVPAYAERDLPRTTTALHRMAYWLMTYWQHIMRHRSAYITVACIVRLLGIPLKDFSARRHLVNAVNMYCTALRLYGSPYAQEPIQDDLDEMCGKRAE